MSWLTQTLSSSIGKKLVMALTGLFLSVFLIVHLVGNLQVFKSDEGLAFNSYTVFMTTNPFIKTISWGLYAMILLHAIDGIYLAYVNRKARGRVGYKRFDNQSSWASRNMAILGSVLFLFIVVHMGNFWYSYNFGEVPFKRYNVDLTEGRLLNTEVMPEDYRLSTKMEQSLSEDGTTKTVIVKDLYSRVDATFSNPLVVLFYLLGVAALAYHLAHGFWSAFQTVGLNHPKYTPLIQGIGFWIFGIIIPVVFAAMPVYIFIRNVM
ncbi:succinate dehydrogenase cytochrome b subunit [Telluribacter sp. SYSU D00476]|uniref:succinate dehydrogenase cytochrome b subunit n=1 Tax=Telluribacter sp. SYSU D00476 TaxID=2811430 RepID=UPI0021D41B97|nr:succinate dehydrogenase cytochrome b subunit [Telluribacter sp. SYSU D00476]